MGRLITLPYLKTTLLYISISSRNEYNVMAVCSYLLLLITYKYLLRHEESVEYLTSIEHPNPLLPVPSPRSHLASGEKGRGQE